MTRITSGLRIGQQVVLANLRKPLPNPFANQGGGPGSKTVVFFGRGGG